MEQTAPKTYTLDGVNYRLERLSFQQCQWMGEHVLYDIDLGDIDEYRVHDLIRSRGHVLAAIALIPDGKTRRQKSEQDWTDIAALAKAFAGTLEPHEIESVGIGFFFVNPPSTLIGAISGAMYKKIRERALASAIATGSPTASSSSAMETLPNSEPSSPTGDPTSVPTTSSDGASIALRSEQSSAGLILSFPG